MIEKLGRIHQSAYSECRFSVFSVFSVFSGKGHTTKLKNFFWLSKKNLKKRITTELEGKGVRFGPYLTDHHYWRDFFAASLSQHHPSGKFLVLSKLCSYISYNIILWKPNIRNWIPSVPDPFFFIFFLLEKNSQKMWSLLVVQLGESEVSAYSLTTKSEL